jgi:hypothetical protein
VWQSVNVHKHTPDQPYFTHKHTSRKRWGCDVLTRVKQVLLQNI